MNLCTVLCYINDLWKITSLFTLLFADDTAGLAKGKDLKVLVKFVNDELKKISFWFLQNKMAVNTSKTKFIVFRPRGKPINDDDVKVVFDCNATHLPQNENLKVELERIHDKGETKNYKLLGVLLDEHLSFDAHVNLISKKLSKSLFCMKRLKNFLPNVCMKSLYYSMIHRILSIV